MLGATGERRAIALSLGVTNKIAVDRRGNDCENGKAVLHYRQGKAIAFLPNINRASICARSLAAQSNYCDSCWCYYYFSRIVNSL